MTRRRARNREVQTIDPRDDPLDEPGTVATLHNDLREVYSPKSGAQLAEEFATEEDEINAVLAEAGGSQGGGQVVVRKLNPETRKFEWLGKYTSAEFISIGGVAYLAQKFGGAEYELIIYGADGRIVKRPKVAIAREAITKTDAANGAAGDKLIAVMLEGFKQLGAQLVQMQRPPESREAILREMQMMKDFFGGGARQDNTLDTLAKILPIVKEMQPRDGETNMLDTMITLAKEFGPTIREAVAKTPALAAPGSAQPGAPVPGASPLSPEQIGANQMQLILKAQLARLCGEAEADSDPGPYAAIIVSKVKPEFLNKIVNDPNWLEELGKVHAGVKLFPKWFEELRESILAEMQPEPDENDDGDEGGGLPSGEPGAAGDYTP